MTDRENDLGGLEIDTTDHDDCRVLTLRGELDVACLGMQAEDFCAKVADAPRRLAICDMREVAFCDSTGIGILIRAAKQLWEHGGVVRLLAPQPHLKHVLTLNGLTTALPMFGDLDDARRTPVGAPPRR
ncbi:STAS domain-containing protein [Phytomonospora sp. NPDC050363]|uniref:STAS domain-containing protein n=1 Tax=Phytomonospora sp. NPDC050363 TaxID=3155642 RepID=UPI0033D4799C